MLAIVFPGQGAQKAGMAADFHAHSAAARGAFDEASEALGEDLAGLCFGDDPRLDLTAWTQPAILTAEIAMWRAMQAEHGLTAGLFGGHSLGEYTALVAAGALPLAEAVRLVHLRGSLMQAACAPGEGAMAAVTGEGLDAAAVLVALDGTGVDLANDNSPDQLVLSGPADGFDAALARVLAGPAAGARATRLTVSAPFHSRRMAPVEADFQVHLARSAPTWTPARAPAVLCNVTGGFHRPTAEALVDALTRQIAGQVRWTANMRALLDRSPRAIWEIGPRRTLRGFFRAIGAEVESITNLVSARRAAQAWAQSATASTR